MARSPFVIASSH